MLYFTDVGNHDGFGVSSEGILEESGEFGVSVRDMRGLLIDERRDNVAERGETLVNVDGFFESASCGLRFGLSLGTSEIDQVEFADSNVIFAFDEFAAFDGDRENGMGPRGMLVHVCRADCSILRAVEEFLAQFFFVVHHERREIFHVDAAAWLFTQFEFLVRLLQQITNFFVVEFQVAHADQELHFRRTLD